MFSLRLRAQSECTTCRPQWARSSEDLFRSPYGFCGERQLAERSRGSSAFLRCVSLCRDWRRCRVRQLRDASGACRRSEAGRQERVSCPQERASFEYPTPAVSASPMLQCWHSYEEDSQGRRTGHQRLRRKVQLQLCKLGAGDMTQSARCVRFKLRMCESTRLDVQSFAECII